MYIIEQLNYSETTEEKTNPSPVSILGERGDKLEIDSFNRTKRYADVYNNATVTDWNPFDEGNLCFNPVLYKLEIFIEEYYCMILYNKKYILMNSTFRRNE